MGYSPGDFESRSGERFHWELKDGPRIVLWDAVESKKVLDLELSEAKNCFEQLNTLIRISDDD